MHLCSLDPSSKRAQRHREERSMGERSSGMAVVGRRRLPASDTCSAKKELKMSGGD